MNKIPFVDLAGENQIYVEEILENIKNIILSGNYILGENLNAFEFNIQNIYKNSYCVGLNSGADALFLGLKCLNLDQSSEVVVPANSFIASAWAVVNAGYKLRFCDVGESMNVTSKSLLQSTNINTKVWMPVHLTGASCDMDDIVVSSSSKSIEIVEDAAQAFGSRHNNELVGEHGVFAAFSLNPLKVLGVMGDGGFLLTRSKYIYDQIKRLRNHGLLVRDDANCWGYNSRLDEIQASIANIKLKNFHNVVSQIRYIANQYITRLNKNIIIPNKDKLNNSVWHRFVIYAENRDELKIYLQNKNIHTAINYEIPLHLTPIGQSLGYQKGDFPNVENQSKIKLSLPLYPHMDNKTLDYVIDSINSFFE